MLENETEIVERAKKDDRAFEILYNYYFPKIYRYIFKRTGSHEATEDLVSVTFTNVFVNLNKYKYRGYSFGAWVYKIATNNLIDYYRKSARKKEVSIEDVQELKNEGNPSEELIQRDQDKKLVQQALKELPKRYQEVLQLKFFAEMPNDEIAKILGTTVNNIRVLIYRALKSFRKIYKTYEKK